MEAIEFLVRVRHNPISPICYSFYLNPNTMKFGKKLSILAFKALHNGATIKVKTNPATGKDFVTADDVVVGVVSHKYDKTLPDKEMVELLNEETGEAVWCLHNPCIANDKETLA